MYLYFLLFFSCFSSLSFAGSTFFVCGPDEDGCYPEIYQYCLCIPYDLKFAQKPYCLDFENLSCQPLELQSNCPQEFIYQDQSHCLAMIYHSGIHRPCALKPIDFCQKYHSYFCNKEGNPQSCLPFKG